MTVEFGRQMRHVLATVVALTIAFAASNIRCAAQDSPGSSTNTMASRGLTESPQFIADDVLQRLDAETIDERRDATRELLNDPSVSEETIYHTLLSHPDLSPEQFDRLMRVAERRRLENPGVIGIWIDQRHVPPGVGVDRVMPQVPAAEVLQSGDVIHVINGHIIDGDLPTDASNALRFAVAASKAGDPIRMVIERHGRHLEVETRLADPQAIPEFGDAPLMSNRREQWSVIEHALLPSGRVLHLVGPDGQPLEEVGRTYDSTLDSALSSEDVVDRRTAWQIETEFTSRLDRLHDLEQATLALAQVAQGTPSLQQALVDRVSRLRAEIETTLKQYRDFKSPGRKPQTGEDTSS